VFAFSTGVVCACIDMSVVVMSVDIDSWSQKEWVAQFTVKTQNHAMAAFF
jgi:hypothetical protein